MLFPRKFCFHFIVWLTTEQKRFSLIFDFLNFRKGDGHRMADSSIFFYEDNEKKIINQLIVNLRIEMMGYIALPNSGNPQNNWISLEIKRNLFPAALSERK